VKVGAIGKLRIYESLFLLNQGIDHVVALLRDMGKFPFADKDSMQCAIVEIEEVRCDMNAGRALLEAASSV
jgi:hypothetical protein